MSFASSDWDESPGLHTSSASIFTDDWEEMINDTENNPNVSSTSALSKEALARLESLRLDEEHNLACANDLLNMDNAPEENQPSQPISKLPLNRQSQCYSIDEARPKTKEDFFHLQRAMIEKICSFKENSMYELVIENFIRELAGLLETNSLRKMTGEMQTMINQKISSSKAIQNNPASITKKGQKPTLKYTSVKTSFDHDLDPYGEDDDYYN